MSGLAVWGWCRWGWGKWGEGGVNVDRHLRSSDWPLGIPCSRITQARFPDRFVFDKTAMVSKGRGNTIKHRKVLEIFWRSHASKPYSY